jgi:hypothetical protein
MKRADIVNLRRLLAGNSRFRCANPRPGFHWEPQKIAQLVVDLENAARETHNEEDVSAECFYLGVITVSPSKSGPSLLLDGLHRLVVLSMFLAFARDRLPGNAERNRLDRLLVRRAIGQAPEPRLRLAPEDHAWFAHFILPPGATRRLPPTAPLGSPRELLLCARFLEHAFSAYQIDDLRSIVDFILHHTAVCRSVGDVAMQPSASSYATVGAPLPAPTFGPRPAPALSAPAWTEQGFSPDLPTHMPAPSPRAVPAARYRVAAE